MMALAYPPQADLDLDRFADKLRTELGNSLPTRIVLVLEEGKFLDELRNWTRLPLSVSSPLVRSLRSHRPHFVDRTLSTRP